MSLIKLTENLENFKWTEYSKAGSGKSPQLDGTDYFERPSQKALEDMESKFGILDTPPGIKGSYDDMKVVDLRTLMNPLAYNIAGVNSDLVYGVVPKQTINFSPSAEGAWGDPLSFLPISTYSSVIPNQLDIEQKTFNIPDSYPNNNSSYSINTQYGWSWENEYLENHGMPWRGFRISDSLKGMQDDPKFDHYSSFPPFYPNAPVQDTQHPAPPIYLNSEPSPAPSYLEMQFLISYGDTNGVWPYKVLGYTGTHPLIRKDIGERFEIGSGTNWMAIQAMRTGDDISRIEKWMETPAGEQWQIQQNMLQDLNPREETRLWNRDSIELSIPPLLHANRHFGGETYMEVGDFGSLLDSEPKDPEPGWFSQTKLGSALSSMGAALSDLNRTLGAVDFLEPPASFGGERDGRLIFLADRFIVGGDPSQDSSISIGNLGDINLTNLRNSSTPFGRPPKIPTQTVFSQAGAYGRAGAQTGAGPDATRPSNPIKMYQTLAYGELGKIDYTRGGEGFLTSPSERNDIVSKVTDEYLAAHRLDARVRGNKQVRDIGDQGNFVRPVLDFDEDGAQLKVIKMGADTLKPSYKNELTDKINIHPYGKDLPEEVSDFVKFKFKDLVNDKFIIFRAILSGISDSITPEWTGTRYIGRPDQVYVYTGTERKISFSFEIYPKTKQEFPVLMEKLNYLVGLCYPSFDENRMVAPFIQLTLGDMFNKTPGFLDSLTVDVDDTGTWEIEEGLQFPKHITCNCSFTYIGKYMPSSLGKHYELPWLTDNGWSAGNEVGKGATYGTFIASDKPKGGEGEDKDTFPIKDNPERGLPMSNLFDKLGAVDI